MFLDIALGILGSYITGAIFNEAITLQMICLGIFFIFLPDMDILWHKSNKKIDHRSFMHYPLLYVVISVVLFFVVNQTIAFLFFVTTLFHFIHDTFILGWGVAWFAPFSYCRYKVFPDDGKGGFLEEKFLTWLPAEQEALEKRLDDKHWIRNWYGRVTIVSVIEYSAFFFAVMYLVYTLL